MLFDPVLGTIFELQIQLCYLYLQQCEEALGLPLNEDKGECRLSCVQTRATISLVSGIFPMGSDMGNPLSEWEGERFYVWHSPVRNGSRRCRT